MSKNTTHFDTIVQQLINLGISKGDVIFVKVDLIKIGLITDGKKPSINKGFLLALKNVVGDKGTILTAAYTKTHFFPWFDKRNKLFYKDKTPPNTGAFARQVWQEKDSFRSSHPTNSHVAIGALADKITSKQDKNQTPYSLIGDVVKVGGKFLIVGCVDSSPGFATAHYAQEELGFASMNRFSGMVGATYIENNQINVYRRRQFGGHNGGAGKFYKHFREKKVMIEGRVGKTSAALAVGRDIIPIEQELFLKNKQFILCDDPECFACRCCWHYSGLDFIKFLRIKIVKKFMKFFESRSK